MELRIFNMQEAQLRAFYHYWKPTYFKPHFIQYGYRVEQWLLTANITSILYYGIFLPFYFIGILLLVKWKYFLALFVACIPILHSLIHAFLVEPLGRYRSPMDFIVATIGLWTMFELAQFFIFMRERIKTV